MIKIKSEEQITKKCLGRQLLTFTCQIPFYICLFNFPWSDLAKLPSKDPSCELIPKLVHEMKLYYTDGF